MRPGRSSKHDAYERIGILTGGGDAPGLNAVIRAVVLTARNRYGWDVVGIRQGYDGLLSDEDADRCAGRSARARSGGARRHDSRRGQPGQSVRARRRKRRRQCRLRRYVRRGAGADGTHGHRRADRGGRRRHDGNRAEAGRAGRESRRRAQDHRQRPEPDRRDLRLRHGDSDGDRSARQAANDRRKPSPRHGDGSDGAQFRLAGADGRRGGRRGRDPDPGNPVRHHDGLRPDRSVAGDAQLQPGRRRGRRGAALAGRRNTTFQAAA